MAVAIIAHGKPLQQFLPVIGRVKTNPVFDRISETILLCKAGRRPPSNASAYAAVLVEGRDNTEVAGSLVLFENLSHLREGDLVLVDGLNGRVRTLYRKGSPHNALFVTGRCDNDCLMCCEPPKAEPDGMLDICLRIVELLKDDPPQCLGITGGEPTLLADGFLRLLTTLKTNLPATTITALTNGRGFADPCYANAVAVIGLERLRFSVPLHADVMDVHDYIAQVPGAFNETVAGLYNLAARGVQIEIRVVLHALSVPRLEALAEWIWRKTPFVSQVALMGLENMGYVKKNWQHLWIDPMDYAVQLRTAVEHLHRRGIAVSIYNLPFCLLKRELWGFARNSISDHKNILLDACRTCEVACYCPGFFKSNEKQVSQHVQPICLEACP